MSTESLTARQQRTFAARQAFANRFSTPEEKRDYFRALGQKSAEGRFVLSGEEAAALKEASATLGEAYAFLRRIAERAKNDSKDQPAESAA
jgi:hypothetical protein